MLTPSRELRGQKGLVLRLGDAEPVPSLPPAFSCPGPQGEDMLPCALPWSEENTRGHRESLLSRQLLTGMLLHASSTASLAPSGGRRASEPPAEASAPPSKCSLSSPASIWGSIEALKGLEGASNKFQLNLMFTQIFLFVKQKSL